MNTQTVKKTKLTATQKIITSQLLENTGINMLDSGGSNGRAWQRNKETGIDFNVSVKVDEYGFTIPVQLYMNTMLERTTECAVIERQLKAGLKRAGEETTDLCYYNGQAIIDVLNEMGYDPNKDWQNTYNGDCDLSQTLQMLDFSIGSEWYTLMETHNGADVRGGYSAARVYKIRDYDYYLMGIVVRDFVAQDDNGNEIRSWDSQYQMMEDCKFEESSGTWVYGDRAISYYSEAEGY